MMQHISIPNGKVIENRIQAPNWENGWPNIRSPKKAFIYLVMQVLRI